jgi:hypothetical protein
MSVPKDTSRRQAGSASKKTYVRQKPLSKDMVLTQCSAMKQQPNLKAIGASDDFELDFESEFEAAQPKFPRASRSVKRVKMHHTPAKRSARVLKLLQDKETAREKARTDNLNTRFLKLPGGKRSPVYVAIAFINRDHRTSKHCIRLLHRKRPHRHDPRFVG